MENYKNFAKRQWEVSFEKRMKEFKKIISNADLCTFIVDEFNDFEKQVILCRENKPQVVYYLWQGMPERTDHAYGKTIRDFTLEKLSPQRREELIFDWLFS